MRCWWVFGHDWHPLHTNRCYCSSPYWHYPAVGVKERTCIKCEKVQTRYPW